MVEYARESVGVKIKTLKYFQEFRPQNVKRKNCFPKIRIEYRNDFIIAISFYS